MSATITPTGTDTISAAGNALDYFIGQCTRWVAEQFSWVGPDWGNAYQWLASAQKAKDPTIGPTLTPPAGAIAVWGPGLPGSRGFGHVADVLGPASGGGFAVSEENYLGPGQTDVRVVTDTANLEGFILPPGSSAQLLPSGVPVGLNPGDVGRFIGGNLGQIPGLGLLEAGGGLDPGKIVGNALTGIGHGFADFTVHSAQNVGLFFQRQLVALVVAVVVAYILFS